MKQFFALPKLLRLSLVSSLLISMTPIAALYPVLFEKDAGLGVDQISLLFTIWAVAYVIFEIPSGALADFYSRKNTIAFGYLARGVGFLLWFWYPSFWGIAAGFTLWALSIACWSGAETAMFHDELSSVGKERLFTKFSGVSESVFMIGSVIGYLMGAILSHLGFRTLSLISAFPSICAGLILLLAHEATREKHTHYIHVMKSSFLSIINSRVLLYLASVLFVTHQTIGVVEEYIPRIFYTNGVSIAGVGLLVAITNVCSAVVLTQLEKVDRVGLTKKILLALGLTIMIAAGLRFRGLATIGLVIVFTIGLVVMRVVMVQELTKHSATKEKATISSVPGFFGGIVGGGLYAMIGFFAARGSEMHVLSWFALGCAVAYVLLLLIKTGQRIQL